MSELELKKGITVYCGSSAGRDPAYLEAAAAVGGEIARRHLPLYYGGGHMGMMGAVGKAVRKGGGTAVAVIPEFMVKRGWNDPEASATIITGSMHERKNIMASRAVGAIALPGGVGTFEELCEIITWRQLGLYDGNIVVLNTGGYYDPWISQFRKAVDEGFYLESHLGLFAVTEDPCEAVALAAADNGPAHIEPKF